MYRYSKIEILESISAQASLFATTQLHQEYGKQAIPRSELSEAKKWHIKHNVYLVNEILDQFRWCSIQDPFFSVGKPVEEWKHEISSEIEFSAFNGQAGFEFLEIRHEKVEIWLNSYFDTEEEYQHSDLLERWIVDMLIYEECRKIAIESVGRFKTGAVNSLPFFLFTRKRKLKEMLAGLLSEAVFAYQSLDSVNIDWYQTLNALNKAYIAGVKWRDPLPNLVTKLARRQNQSDIGMGSTSRMVDA